MAELKAELQKLLEGDIANLTKPEIDTNFKELKNALEGIDVHSSTDNCHWQQRGAWVEMGMIPSHRFGPGLV